MIIEAAAVLEDAVIVEYSEALRGNPVRLVIRKITVKSTEY
jgi:hypothetical protein